MNATPTPTQQAYFTSISKRTASDIEVLKEVVGPAQASIAVAVGTELTAVIAAASEVGASPQTIAATLECVLKQVRQTVVDVETLLNLGKKEAA